MAKKNIDITKVGPQNYRQLQNANNEIYSTPVIDKFRKNYIPLGRNMDPYVNATQEIRLPDIGNTSWGESVYDKPNTTIDALQHIGDLRAEEQSAAAKLSAGIAKGGILATTTFLNGTVGLIAGLGEWAMTGKVSKIWDNDFSRLMDDITEKSEQVLPNYYSDKELNSPWYTNIFTANFLGDKFLKNLGFTIGAYYSGSVYTKGLGALLKGLNASAKTAIITNTGVGSLISAVNEGSIEGLKAADEFYNEHAPKIQQHLKEKLALAKETYEANKGKTMIRVGETLMDAAYYNYQQTIQQEQQRYGKAMAKLEEDRAKVGNTTLLLNIPILTASNIVQFGNLYSKGFNTASRNTPNLVGTRGNWSAKNLSKAAKTATILKGGIAEGSEEMAQRNASDTQKSYYAQDFNNYYRALHGLEAEDETLNWVKTAGSVMAKNFTDNGANAAWEEFTIGALTGLLGMPRFRSIRNSETKKLQSPIVLEGDFISKWKELRENANRDQAIADKLNERFNSKEFKNYYQGLKRHQKYQNDMDDSAARNDEFDYKNAEHAQLLSDIELFGNAGKLEDLKTAIGEAFNTSDENLDAIIQSTTKIDNNGDLIGPYAKYAKKNPDGSIIANLENKESKDEMIESLKSDRDRVLDTIKNYETTREKIDKKTNYSLTGENLNELTWLSTQLNNWEDRASEMMGKVQESIGSILGAFDTHKRFYEAIINKEGAASAELTDEYKRADKTLRIINENIKILESLRSADTQTIVRELIDHPGLIKNVLNVLDKIDPTVINAVEQKDLRTKLNDLLRLRDAYETFNHKFIEYINNPEKLDEDHKQVDKQIEEQRAVQDMVKKLEAINKATNYGELQSLIDSEEVTEDDINNGQSEVAKSFKKASLLRRKASEIIEEANMPSQQKSIFNQMLSSRFNEQTNYDDLTNTSLLSELPLEAQILDDNIKEALIGMFGEIINQANDKVNGGNRQKQNVDVKPNGTVRPPNTGKDDVMLPPQQSESLEDTMTKILESSKLPGPVKQLAIPLIKEVITDLKTLQKTLDKALLNKVTKSINEIKGFIGESKAQPLIDKLNSLSSLAPESDKLVISSPEEVLKALEEEAKEYKPTAVTGVLKAVVPQFDLDAKRNGELIDFVGDDRNQGYSYVYNKLKEIDPKTGKNAFDYVNEGNVKEGDELEVRYEPATDGHPELLALYHNDILVNYMNTDERIDGVKEIKDKAKNGENPTIRVSKIMDGQYGYSRTNPRSIGELLGTDDAIIGVMRNGDMYANTGDYIEPVFNEAESDGKVYIMLPNSKGTLTPKQIYIRHLNKAEFDLNIADNEIANEVREVFKKLANLSKATDPETTLNDDIFPELAGILYLPDSFHINVETKNTDLILQIGYDKDGKRHNENITLIKNVVRSFSFGITSGESINGTPTPIDANEVYKQIIEAFYNANLAFNINSKELEGKDGQKYANKLRDSGVLFTYLTDKKMQGTWFLLGDAPRNDLSNTAFERQKAKDANKVGVKLEYNGNTYYVDLRTGDIYNDTNAVVQLDKKETQLLNDLAYIQHTYGDTLYGINQINGRVLINNNGSKRGYDRNTNRYLSNEELAKLENEILALKDIQEKVATISSDLIADQELVKRKDDGSPDTTDEAYFIKEEDGQYYEYQRVHSIIDDLYGKQYVGSYTGPKNNAATTQGTLVDDIARQFFINNRVKKPEGISRGAFKNLIESLEEFKNKLTREGFIIKTDRIVLFNKYSDDTRIAGELDMYAYNPTTGEVRIYDFKTSKYSTRDTKFSVVPNSDYRRSNKDQYTLQLSVYAKLFEDRYGKKVSKLTILPFWIHYNNAGINSLTSEQEVPLTYDEDVLQGLSSDTDKGPEVNKKSAARNAAHILGSLKPKTPIEPKEDPNPPQTIIKPSISDDGNVDISEQDRSKATVENWDALDKNIQQLFMKSIGTNDVEMAKQFWDSSDSTYREQMLNCG